MRVRTPEASRVSSPERHAVLVQASLCGLATAVSIARAVRTGEMGGTTVGLVAAAFALLALGTTLRSRRWAIAPLAAAIVMEFTVMLGAVAPPRIVNAIPLLFALGLAAAPADLTAGRVTGDRPANRRIVTAISVGLMLPVGVAYLVATNLIAPFPDILFSYVLYALLVTATIRLARRRSWWIVAMPFISGGLFLLMVLVGETYRGWSA